MATIQNEKRRKQQKKTKPWKICKIFGIYVEQFLKHTNLQGLIYVGNAQLALWERCYFLVLFIAFIIIAINFATNVYVRWETNPIIIGSESDPSSIFTIPFPAITVCNMNQLMRSKIKKYPRHSLGYAMTQKICFQDVNYSQFDDLEPASKDDTFPNFIWRVNGQTCDNMIVYCRYGDKEDQCTDFFREVLMDEGICCAFNILHPSYLYKGKYIFVRDFTSSIGTIPVDWNLETGYAANLPMYYYPRRPLGEGVSLGFTIVLNANISEYTCSSTFGTGLKVIQVITHNPIDTPHVKEIGLSVQPGYQHRFLLDVESSQALESTRAIPPKRRQCVFNNELELYYYRYYTIRNCESECDSKYYLRRCQCIPYHLPLIYPTAKVCGVKDFNCENEVDEKINDKLHLACKEKCLPSCFNLEYSVTVYSTPLLNATFGFRDRFFENRSSFEVQENLALVEVYFKDDVFRAAVRSPYTSFTDYLSQTGGIMSLMVGFGVMTIPEFLYFFLIRPFFDLLLKRLPGAVRKVVGGTGMRFRRYVHGNRVIVVAEQKFPPYSQKPLATSRRPIRLPTGYGNQKMHNQNSSLKNVLLQGHSIFDIEPEAEGLFPYIE